MLFAVQVWSKAARPDPNGCPDQRSLYIHLLDCSDAMEAINESQVKQMCSSV